MSKFKFVSEYAFKTSPKVIYNYISTPGGLQQWFSNEVSIDSKQQYIIEWDGKKHIARVTKKRNISAKFDFMGEEEGNSLELKLILGELDGSTYLEVTDISDNHDEDELQDLWQGFVDNLKDIVGG
jgi:uncharacterized protein YndB with AHSA1/START domain